MDLHIYKPLVKYGKVVLFIILTPILIFVYPFYFLSRGLPMPTIGRNREHTLDVILAKYGTKYTDGFFSKMIYGYNETKFEEIRQWTAAYGEEEAGRMYKEKYCNDKKQENSTTRG